MVNKRSSDLAAYANLREFTTFLIGWIAVARGTKSGQKIGNFDRSEERRVSRIESRFSAGSSAFRVLAGSRVLTARSNQEKDESPKRLLGAHRVVSTKRLNLAAQCQRFTLILSN